MLNVTFIRHAKSEWKSFDGNDFNRDISEIGMEKTKKIGSFLKKKKLFLTKCYVHLPLEREKTLDILSPFFSNKPKVKYIEDLYHTSGKNLFDLLMLNAKKKKDA